jgi:hypothetical protein
MEKEEINLVTNGPVFTHCLTASQVEEINDLIWQLGMRVHEILSEDR